MTVDDLCVFAGQDVRVSLRDGSERLGRLRTELLGPRSVSVFIIEPGDEGATLYIDDIVRVSAQTTA